MHYRVLLRCLIGLSVMCAQGAAAEPVTDELARLVEDYRHDPNRLDITFGLRIDGGDWTVTSRKDQVKLSEGSPGEPAWILVMNEKVFSRIAAGNMSALTAMAQARASDPTLITIDTVEGFTLDATTQQQLISVLFHFFTTGQPEIVPLGSGHSRVVHGGSAIPIYYAPNLRLAWYAVEAGQHINEETRDQVNDFPSIMICTKAGSVRARIGGKDVTLRDNIAVFIPPGMAHEIWNPGEVEGQFILLMFGENA